MSALCRSTFACWLSISLASAASIGGCEGKTESTAPADASSATPEPGDQHTQIRGRLLGHDGQPAPLAELHVTLVGQAEIAVPVAADGDFAIDLPAPGWTRMRLTAVGHEEHTFEFLATGGEHRLEVRLGTYDRPDTHESLFGFGRYDGEGERVSLTFRKRDDGTWAAELARGEAGASAAEFHYQIANATSEGRTINGTQADRYVYDGGGDYFSVIALDPSTEGADELELVWDPAAMPPAGRELAWSFADPESTIARSVQLCEQLERERVEAMRAARVEAATGKVDPEQAFAEAEAKQRSRLAEAVAAESDPVLRRMLWVAWADSLDSDPTPAVKAELGPRVETMLEELGHRDPVWSMREWAMATALRYVDRPQYFALAAAEHPNAYVSAALWLSTLIAADEAGESERAREAMTALADPRFAEVETVALTKLYDPDRPTAPGRMVPDFRVTAADGKTELSASDLRGKTYVLDFWATWCGPCIAEMPKLHAAYATLNGEAAVDDRNYRAIADPTLELISISFDHDLRVVENFREEQWPMPWVHAVPDEAKHKQLAAQFGIVGIPTMVLVGPDGTILASSPRLDGGNLGEIAAEFLR